MIELFKLAVVVFKFSIATFEEPVAASKFVKVSALSVLTTVVPSTNLIEPVEIYKSFQIFVAEPKSNAFVSDGISDELKDATTFTVSDVWSPIVSCPPNVKLPAMFAFPVMSNPEPEIAPNVPVLPVPVEPKVMSPSGPPTCRVPNVVFTYGSPNANEPDFCAVVPRLNLSPI